MDNNQNHKPFDLEQRTLEFAKKVIRLCKKLPNNKINSELISQLVRASGSVGANYREANDTLTKKDFVYKMGICLREAKESNYWLELTLEANSDFKEEINKLLQETIELRKIFASIVNKSK
ncbi:MAG: four helix bundle protein [Planctomycetota bacterium]